MLFGVHDELQTDLVFKNVTTRNSKEEKVLVITYDNKLDFSIWLDLFTSITKKANVKLNTFIRVQNYITPKPNTFLSSSFTKSRFNYCPLIWIFCSKETLHRLNDIHGRFLRLIYQDYVSNFVILLVNANEKSIHQNRLEFLMMDGYKYLNGLNDSNNEWYFSSL